MVIYLELHLSWCKQFPSVCEMAKDFYCKFIYRTSNWRPSYSLVKFSLSTSSPFRFEPFPLRALSTSSNGNSDFSVQWMPATSTATLNTGQ